MSSRTAISRLLTSRPLSAFRVPIARQVPSIQAFHTSPRRLAGQHVESELLSDITEREKDLSGRQQPIKGGPTAQAQKHVHEELDAGVVSDIAKGEKKITGQEGQVQGGPAAMAQSILTGGSPSQATTSSGTAGTEQHSGRLDSATISSIADAEKKLTGSDRPVQGGPTARAQKHANEPITSEALHDITEGEKLVTGGERVKGGPTSTAQSELGKSRS